MQRLCSSFRVVWETATVGFSWIGGGCTFASRIGTAMAGVWGGKRSSVKTATSMGCQWDANGMLMECQWNANGVPMGGFLVQVQSFFLLKFVFVPIWRFLPFFLSTPFFFIIHSRFIFFFLPSLLLSSGISIAINPLIATYLRLLSNPSVCAHLVALPPDVPFRSSLPRTAPATTGFD